jgi:tetratricopeptide (TPR) repeat protein
LARGAVDRYFTNVSEEVLLNEPQMEPLRKKLLQDAQEYYDQFVQEHADDPEVRGELGKTIFRLAQITGDIGSKAEAIKLHRQAAAIFEKPPQTEYRGELAACYHHMGRLYWRTDQPDAAEAAYLKALALWQQLAEEKPHSETQQAGLARTQLGLGNVHQFRRRFGDAEKEYRQALAIRQALAQAHPKNAAHQRDLAVNYVNLASVLAVVGKKEKQQEAISAYEKARGIQQKLVEDFAHISQYQDDLALTRFQLGNLDAKAGQNDRALVEFAKAVEGWRALTKTHPDVKAFRTKLASGLMVLAEAFLKTQDPKKLKDAEAACEEAVTLNLQLAREDQSPPTYQADLGRNDYCRGEVYAGRGQMDKAAAAYLEGIGKLEGVLPSLPQSPHYESVLARSYLRLGFLYETDKKTDKADAAYKKALSRWEKLAKNYPDDPEFAEGLAITKQNLCNTHWARAVTLEKMQRYVEALQAWDRAFELAKASQKNAILLPRLIVLARTGRHEDAAKEAGQLDLTGAGGGTLYRFASIYSLSAAAAATDVKLPAEEREQLADQFAAKAVALLTSAAAKGLFKTPANLDKLNTDPDMQALRPRDDFKKLCGKLESK